MSEKLPKLVLGNAYTFDLNRRFTDLQLEYIVVMRRQMGATRVATAEAFNKRFGTKYTEATLQGLYYRLGDAVDAARTAAAEPHPHADFTREAIGPRVKDKDHKNKKFFVTAVQAGARLHIEGFGAALRWCEEQKAELVLLPMRAHAQPLQGQPQHYDPLLKPYRSKFATDYTFNKNVRAVELQINPQQVNPLTGLHRIKGAKTDMSVLPSVGRRTSILLAHAKQEMKLFPVDNGGLPRMLHSTGAITMPEYLTDTRIGLVAQEDHIVGGLILEVRGDLFFVRQVQIGHDGTFVSLGRRYFHDKPSTPERAEAFVMGDVHPGMHSDTALGAWYKCFDLLKPKALFLHDFFDGGSISHHVENTRLTKATRPKVFRSLRAELGVAKDVLYEIIDKAPKDTTVYAVASNHPEHVTRYLEEGRYLRDNPDNYEMAHRMVVAALDGNNFLQQHLDPESRMVWLESEDDVFIEGVSQALSTRMAMSWRWA